MGSQAEGVGGVAGEPGGAHGAVGGCDGRQEVLGAGIQAAMQGGQRSWNTSEGEGDMCRELSAFWVISRCSRVM